MFDKLYTLVVKTFIYIMSGMIGGKVSALYNIKMFSTGWFIFLIIWLASTIFVVEYGLYFVRRNKQ